MKRIGAGLAVLALASVSMPAAAGDRHPRRHRNPDKVDAGDVALGAVLLGGVLAILSSGKKRAAANAGPQPSPDLADAIPASAPLDADGAADVCAQAAEAQGTRLARIVRVDRISDVAASDDGWVTRGMLVLRDSFRENGDARVRGFRCAVATTGMPDVTFDGEKLAAR